MISMISGVLSSIAAGAGAGSGAGAAAGAGSGAAAGAARASISSAHAPARNKVDLIMSVCASLYEPQLFLLLISANEKNASVSKIVAVPCVSFHFGLCNDVTRKTWFSP